ncbi:glucokinase [Methylobacterium marchantiae]|uniref:Glucokinase n=1 Tax=Methylobacterium marchantiae TaxID=600331 RepID=A0ABW3WYX5_9HYPH|nr:Glucokinase [Methylobacterium marchantiae]
MFEFPVLVGDVGGTNARFALVAEAGAEAKILGHVQTKAFPDPSAAIRSALEKHDGPAPRSGILAVAARIDGPAVRLTNADWVIEGERIGRDFGLSRSVVVNDYVPVAAGAVDIAPTDLTPVGPRRDGGLKGDQGTRLVLGPGTGFGAAAVVPYADRLAIVSTEAGHVDFGPTDADEQAVWRHVERIEGRVTVEALLSGPGLARLYKAVHLARTGREAADAEPAKVTSTGVDGSDPYAVEAVALFAKLLGRVCGDLALTFLATGGVYIGGGIAPRILPVLEKGGFRKAFESKPPFVTQMEAIPTAVISVQDPAFSGLAALANRPEVFVYHGQVWTRE